MDAHSKDFVNSISTSMSNVPTSFSAISKTRFTTFPHPIRILLVIRIIHSGSLTTTLWNRPTHGCFSENYKLRLFKFRVSLNILLICTLFNLLLLISHTLFSNCLHWVDFWSCILVNLLKNNSHTHLVDQKKSVQLKWRKNIFIFRCNRVYLVQLL